VVAPGVRYAGRVEVLVLPSGVEDTDYDGVVEYVHVRLTAFVIVSTAPRTSYVREVGWPKSDKATAQNPTKSPSRQSAPEGPVFSMGWTPL